MGDDDPTDTPTGDLGEWEHSNARLDIERGSNISTRIVPSDSTTVHQFIESLQRR